MLPPVLASANAYASAAEAKQRPDQTISARPATTNVPAAPTAIAREATVAGQLNMMLLSGPERMSQNLAALADVLGSALKIERRVDESLTDYMGRLIDGIVGLPAADRLKLQKLLAQSFAGLQLRTLLDAMANPSGPEHTTLALYLELYRQTDRDGAARSVISSYRELAGDLRSADASPARRIAANDAGRPVADAPLPNQKTGEQLQGTRLAAQAVGGETETGAESPPSAPARPSNTDAALPSRSSVSSAALRLAGEQPQSEPPRTSAASTPNQSTQLPKASTDATTARPVLPDLAEPTADDHSTPRSGEPLPPSRNAPTERPAQAETDGRQTIERAALLGAAPPSIPADLRPAPLLPAAWLAEMLETDFVKALLQLKTLSADVGGQILANSRPAAADKAPPIPSSETVMPDEAADKREHAIRMLDPASPEHTEERSLPPPALLAEQAQIRPAIAREGIPLPFISYLIDDDFKEDRVEEEKEQDEQAGGRGESDDHDPEDSGEPAGEDSQTDTVSDNSAGQIDVSAGPAALEQESAPAALPPPADSPLSLRVEPAHELYLRMAGLN
ncbi:MAG: hypothetical protein ACT6RF_14725 [Allorhizobium sp.]|uniref:hypothetical protein n=1 Tax=Allorhizobium sp. TaxID=633478 RepID=UPI004034C73D